MHLTLNGCVAIRFKMLTYSVYAPRLNRIDALPLNVIYNFKIASILNRGKSFDNQDYRRRVEGQEAGNGARHKNAADC
jgi:hypothetical protein